MTFSPTKFVLYSKSVYCRASDEKVYVYGGGYDTTQPIIEFPWLDGGTPATNKAANGFHLGLTGQWKVEASMDNKDGRLYPIAQSVGSISPNVLVDSTFPDGNISYQASGTHWKLKLTGGGSRHGCHDAARAAFNERYAVAVSPDMPRGWLDEDLQQRLTKWPDGRGSSAFKPEDAVEVNLGPRGLSITVQKMPDGMAHWQHLAELGQQLAARLAVARR